MGVTTMAVITMVATTIITAVRGAIMITMTTISELSGNGGTLFCHSDPRSGEEPAVSRPLGSAGRNYERISHPA